MNVYSTRQLLTGLAVATTLVIVAACSGTSPSMNPTSPSSVSAVAGANFSPNPTCPGDPECPPPPPTCETDPTLPECLLSGRFTGGGFQLLGDIKVTRGFTIHCDNRLTNNLEINWPDGNNFHMEKNTLVDVTCELIQPPNPPAAGVSRITATADGTCNKAPARITFVLEDRGEPGTSDRAAFNISGGCTLVVPEGFIDGGNIQAHFDQPHREK